MPSTDLITKLARNEHTLPQIWLKELWESPKVGKYLPALAKELDCHLKTARDYLVSHGVVPPDAKGLYTLRPEDTVRGGELQTRIEAQGFPKGTSLGTYLHKMAEQGFGSYLIAERLGCTPRTIRNQAEKLGLKLPKRSMSENCNYRAMATPTPEAEEAKRAALAKTYTTTDGRTFTLRELAEKTGVTYLAVLYRIRKWGIDRAANAEKKS